MPQISTANRRKRGAPPRITRMDVKIIAKSRQRDGTQHLEATAPAETPVDDVVTALIKKLGMHPDCEGWGEVKDDSSASTWIYQISIEP